MPVKRHIQGGLPEIKRFTSRHNLLAVATKHVTDRITGTLTLGQNFNIRSYSQLQAVGRDFIAPSVYTLNNSTFEVGLLVLFGFVGYMFIKWKCEPAPLLLAFVLGPLIEENLRRAMRISSGDPMIFVNRPISLGLLIAATILLLIVALPAIRGKRDEVFQEG